ncbi:MAG: hypothetical protein AB7G13_36115 [Lautropia sp.]
MPLDEVNLEQIAQTLAGVEPEGEGPSMAIFDIEDWRLVFEPLRSGGEGARGEWNWMLSYCGRLH